MTALEDKVRKAVLEAISLEGIEQALDEVPVEASITPEQNIRIKRGRSTFLAVLKIVTV